MDSFHEKSAQVKSCYFSRDTNYGSALTDRIRREIRTIKGVDSRGQWDKERRKSASKTERNFEIMKKDLFLN